MKYAKQWVVVGFLLFSLLLLGCTNPLWNEITGPSTSSFCTALVDQYKYDLMILRNNERVTLPAKSVDDILSTVVRKSDSVDEIIEWLNEQECVHKARFSQEIISSRPATEIHVTLVNGLPLEAHAFFIMINNKNGKLEYDGIVFLIE